MQCKSKNYSGPQKKLPVFGVRFMFSNVFLSPKHEYIAKIGSQNAKKKKTEEIENEVFLSSMSIFLQISAGICNHILRYKLLLELQKDEKKE